MYPRSIIIAVFLAIIPLTAVAQSHSAVNKSELDPPSIQIVVSGTHTNGDAVISQLLDAPVEMPLGPIDVLKGYESAMTAIAETTVAVLTSISQAVLEGQISDPIHLDHLRIIPTGVGESSSLSAPPGLNYSIGTRMPDGKQILVVASGVGRTPVTYLQDIASGAAHQITHEGRYAVLFNDVAVSVSPDGQYFLTTDGANHYWIQPIGGGEPREIKGLVEGDFPLEWHKDSQNIFFERRGSLDAIDIYDLNLTNGQQKLWTHFSPTDKTALVTMRHALITPDGAHSLYAVQRIYSTLFVAKNIR